MSRKLDKLNRYRGLIIDKIKVMCEENERKELGERDWFCDVLDAALDELGLSDFYWSMEDEERDAFSDIVAYHTWSKEET